MQLFADFFKMLFLSLYSVTFQMSVHEVHFKGQVAFKKSTNSLEATTSLGGGREWINIQLQLIMYCEMLQNCEYRWDNQVWIQTGKNVCEISVPLYLIVNLFFVPSLKKKSITVCNNEFFSIVVTIETIELFAQWLLPANTLQQVIPCCPFLPWEEPWSRSPGQRFKCPLIPGF